MTTKQLEKLDWKLVEGATGNIHSACYDVKTQNCFVRFGYGDTDDGVTGIGVYRGVVKEDYRAWEKTFPEHAPNDNSFRQILTYPFEKLVTIKAVNEFFNQT